MLQERLALARELTDLGEQFRNLDTETWGHRWYVNDLFRRDDSATLDEQLDRLRDSPVTRLVDPCDLGLDHTPRAGRALAGGDLNNARRLTDDALALAGEMGSSYSISASAFMLGLVRWFEGRLGEFAEGLLDAVKAAAPRVLLLALYLDEGDHEQAASEVAIIKSQEIDGGGDDPLALAILGEAAWALADTELEGQVYEHMSPLATQYVVLGAGIGVICPVHHVLALAAATAGRFDAATNILRQPWTKNKPPAYTLSSSSQWSRWAK